MNVVNFENKNDLVLKFAVAGVIVHLLATLKRKHDHQKKITDQENKKKVEYLLGKRYFEKWDHGSFPVIVSLTTSPVRIQHIKQVLDGIHPSTYDIICVNLPDSYGRTGETYTIPEWMETYPKLVINRFGKDLGPISKVLPTMERYPHAFIVSIDDDILYKPYFIHLLGHVYDAQKSTHNNAIVAQHGTNMSSFWAGLKKRNRPLVEEGLKLFRQVEKNKDKDSYKARNFNYRYIELIEGFSGIMYSPFSYNPAIVHQLKQFSALSKACFQSDDMVLSTCFSLHRVPKISIGNVGKNYIFQMVRPLEYGLREDALHNIQSHYSNYIQALKDIVNSLK